VTKVPGGIPRGTCRSKTTSSVTKVPGGIPRIKEGKRPPTSGLKERSPDRAVRGFSMIAIWDGLARDFADHGEPIRPKT
jgi:hypothetical protein